MKHVRRLLSLCLVFAFTVFCFKAFSGDEIQVIRAFAGDGLLRAYVDTSAVTQPLTRADLKLGGQSYPSAGTLGTARQAGLPVEFMLLLDISTSMPDFESDILAFAEHLAQYSGEATGYAMATFGDVFEIVAEATDPDSVAQALAAMQYTAQSTKIYSGLESALDYYGDAKRQGTGFYNILLLTDGVEYNKDGGITYDALLERLGGTEVMVHTIGFGEDIEALASLGTLSLATGGQHWVLDGANAETAAQGIADYLGDLLLAQFDISGFASPGGVQAFTINFASGSELVCRVEAQVEIPASDGTASGAGGSSGTSGGGGSAATTQGGADAAENPQNKSTVAVIIAMVAVLVAGAAAIILVKRKQKSTPAQPDQGGTYMRLEVVAGDFAGGSTELSLVDALVVGRDRSCDIVFNNPALARRNARVFKANGAVYIEDLGSTNGTRVNGISIEMPNILRSGDEITVGDAVFRLKF